MNRINSSKTKSESESYFVIGWEQDERVYSTSKIPEDRKKVVFFKSNRYDHYSGNLQVEYYPADAKHWKTYKGALSALDRLKANDKTRRTRNAVVCRFTKTITEQRSLYVATGEVIDG